MHHLSDCSKTVLKRTLPEVYLGVNKNITVTCHVWIRSHGQSHYSNNNSNSIHGLGRITSFCKLNYQEQRRSPEKYLLPFDSNCCMRNRTTTTCRESAESEFSSCLLWERTLCSTIYCSVQTGIRSWASHSLHKSGVCESGTKIEKLNAFFSVSRHVW